MATVEPLSPTEEALWRAVMRIVKVIPRHLDSDLIRGAGLTASEYTTIMHLSEAPNRELRMADLANATDLSASRMIRLVDDLQFWRPRDENSKLLGRPGQRGQAHPSGYGRTEVGMAGPPRQRTAPLPRLHRHRDA